ncbi:MAG: hypothetical protein GTO14_00255 [Anaerolineales bacterium]|nr:hypothetical protein [Anaerolineales bacterium]
MVKLEIIVDTLQDALFAERAGATQLDLKADFPNGGVTQSAGMIEHVCKTLGIPVMVMIRPHHRAWIMNEDDLEIMYRDIHVARQFGAEHFLLGCLNEAGEIHRAAYKRFQDAAGDGFLHSHLVWEKATNPSEALQALISLGVKSVRTTGGSGLGGKVEDNLAAVRSFVERAQGQIEFFLAGGVHAGNVEKLVLETGITNLHIGTGAREPANREGVVTEKKVKQIREALDQVVVS